MLTEAPAPTSMTRTLHSFLEAGVTVLTASRRLAYALREDYARQCQQVGHDVWRSPRVLPWATWLREQWLETRSHSSDAPIQLLNGAQSRILWDEVVHSSELSRSLLSPSSAARLAARSWQRMHEYCIDFDALDGSTSAETQAFASWARDFGQRCDALGAIDEAQLAQLALRTGFVPTQAVCFAGFDVLPPVLRELSALWQQAGQLHFVDNTTVAAAPPMVRKVAAADRENELTLAASWARARVAAGARSVGIVVNALQDRRHDVRRIFEDAFAPAARRAGIEDVAIPVTIAAPEALTEYPLVADALAVLQLGNGDCDSLLAGRLLRSPFVVAADTERHVRALADVRLRDEQRHRWDWSEFERWAALTGCTQLQLAAREVANQVREQQSSGTATASVWSERCVRELRSIQWPGERTRSSVEHQTVAKFNEVLAQFGTLDAILGPMSRVTALQRLRELTQETSFEAQSGPSAVTVIDPATVAGMQFDAIWVAGLDAAQLPGPTSPDPFLPIELQRAAGIAEAMARTMLDQGRRQLQRLIASAPEVMLSWPHREGDAELQPSPLLAGIAHVDRGTWLTSSTMTLRRLLFEQRPLPEFLSDHFAPRVNASSARGGATILELQSRCAFRAQAQLRLRADPLSAVSLGLEPRERGNLLHKALEALWQELSSQEHLASLDDERLSGLILSVAERTAAATLQPGNRMETRLMALEVQAIVQQLFALMMIERARPPFAVRRAEYSEVFALSGLSIRLKPDRIDRLISGGDLLVDYKLGDSHQPRQWLDEIPGRPRRPQLPLYALAHIESVQALAFVVAAPGTVEYRGWSNGAAVADGVKPYPQGVRLRPGDPTDWNALLLHWRTTLTALADSFIAGVATVDPLREECTYCHLSTFCRIHEVTAQTGADVGADDE